MARRTWAACLLGWAAVMLAGCEGENPNAPSVIGETPAAGPSPPAPRAPPVPPAVGYGLTAVSLSGVVFETTATGRASIAGATVYCDACGHEGHTWLTTDGDGAYRFSGDLEAGGGIWLAGPTTQIMVAKDGYGDPSSFPGGGWRSVTIDGDTRYDIELVRK